MKTGKLKKRLLPVLLAGTMVMNSNLCALGARISGEAFRQEILQRDLARQAAAEGMVLLENKNQVLPLENTESLALWGGGACYTAEGNNIWQALEDAGYQITTTQWLSDYEKNNQGSLGADEALTSEDLDAGAKDGTDTAIYVISREWDESTDRTEGEFFLTDTEQANIEKMAENFQNSVVVLNVGGVMDTSFVQEINKLDGVILMSQAGQEGADALADILNGSVTPSGKLTDTWALQYEDYPTAEDFGDNDGNSREERYDEGIYVGYRYFDTFGLDVAYEFGYGESYTDFAIEVDEVRADEDRVEVDVTVTNTGDLYSGKEVVQIYYSAPQGELEQPYQQLGAYAKTDLLDPGESQELTIGFSTTQMASYDKRRASYVMEAGDYILRVGDSSRNTSAAAVLSLEKTVVTEILGIELPCKDGLEEMSNAQADPITYPQEEQEIAQAPVVKLPYAKLRYHDGYNESLYQDEDVTTYVPEGTDTSSLPVAEGSYDQKIKEVSVKEGAKLWDVYSGQVSMEEFVAGLTYEELANLIAVPVNAESGTGQGTSRVTTGAYADALGIPQMALEDDQGLYDIAWPSQTLLAQTWNTELVEQIGEAIGTQMQESGVTLWLGPNLNIHRDPLWGKSSESYSEDPLLVGTMGAAVTKGVQSIPGIGVAVEGFGAGNQEANSTAQNSVLSERSLREIYLKGFEIAVKSAQPMAVVPSYNKINGSWAAGSHDLCTDILRGEWAFQGIVIAGEESAVPVREAVHGGSDLLLSEENADGVLDTLKKGSNRRGKLYLGDVQESVMHFLEALMNTISFKEMNSQAELIPYTEKYSSILKAYVSVVKGNAQEEIDTADLDRWIFLAEELDESDYTSESWRVLSEALENAKKVREQAVSQKEINEARDALAKAYLELEYGVQKEHLQAAVKAAEEILENYWNYEPEGIEALRKNLAEAKEILEDSKATQEEIDQAAEDLMAAMEQLIVSDDVFMLQSLLNAVDVIDTGKYTSISAQEFKDAVAQAEAVLQNANRTEQDIKEAYQRLAMAVMGLQLKGNKDGLLFVIEKAQGILAESENYLADGILGLEEALEAARDVYEDENAVQTQVAAATEELTRALAKVRLKGDVDLDGSVSTKDSVRLLQYHAEVLELTEEQLEGADVNGDGIADTKDSVLILQYMAEKISSFGA